MIDISKKNRLNSRSKLYAGTKNISVYVEFREGIICFHNVRAQAAHSKVWAKAQF